MADKHGFDTPGGLLSPTGLRDLAPLLAELRRRRYDDLLLFHHLTTWFGVAKYTALTRAIAARRTIGLDNGRGKFLDVRVPDEGFGHAHEVEYGLEIAAAAGARARDDARIEIALESRDRRRAAELLGETGASPATESAPRRWIALHAGGGTYSLARRWPPAAFADVGRTLARETEAGIVLLGTEVDRSASDDVAALLGGGVLNLVGRASVKETAAVLERCRLLVSNDSGVVYLATAVGTPVAAVFGPSNDRAWGPYPAARHRVVRATLPCAPCFYRDKRLGTPQGCPTRDCLKLVTPEMVLAAARELLPA